MSLTTQSESGTVKSIFIKHAKDAFISDENLSKDWQALNYLGKPDYTIALSEYTSFEKLLKSLGAEVHYFPADNTVSMDSIYCRDAAIATDKGVVICNMGKAGRMNEPTAQRKAFEKAGFTILGEITAPGTVEGGDVAWLDTKTMAVGHTYRTNEEGIRQLTALLAPAGIKVVSYPLPHYKGPSDVFHLMSIFSPVAPDVAVVYSPLMPIVFRNELINRGYKLVEVPDEEFDSMGCNVLAIAPKVCIMVKGNPKTKAGLLSAGCTVHEYEGQEISVKGGGGPTCLTRPMYREVV